MLEAAHVPTLAADASGAGPRRSLILAGGGMRVAYQAGVLLALEEEGLRFAHADGTSGGTINLAMLLSALPPAEIVERWRTLRVRDFSSLLPLRRYLRPWRLLGFGDADGIVGRVFPHLGIDVARIRVARGIEGTFNVCDYGAKTNVAVPHTEIDIDLLVAGITLPIFMPPVQRGATTYVDSVWIKDANPTEAVRRGCDELWLVWCIGNSGVYRRGAFDQYVHMIELSANGALFEELGHLRAEAEAAGRTLRLHVIKPEFPLPLDPDFYLGRIDADALVSMGYRDARAYLARRSDDGAPWDPSATRMRDPRLGVAFSRRAHGGRIRVDVRDLARFGSKEDGEAVGVVDGEPASGTFHLDGRRHVYALEVGRERREVVVRGRGLRDTLSALPRLHATGSDSLAGSIAAVAGFAWRLLRGSR